MHLVPVTESFDSSIIGSFSSKDPLLDDYLDAFLLEIIDCAFEVLNTYCLSFTDSFSGVGSFATSMRLICQLNTGKPVICTSLFVFR